MTDQATRIVPAGWYEDPASTTHVRWWNGLAWTEHTAPKPTTHPARAPAPEQDETAARIAEARKLERQYGIGTGENQVVADSIATTDDADLAAWRASDGAGSPVAPSTSTASSWLIALWPVFTLAGLAGAAYLYFYIVPVLAVVGIAAVPYLLGILWAVLDARRLRSRGHRPATPLLSLLGPLVYLIGRRTRVRGIAPLLTFIVLLAVATAGPVTAWATGLARPVLTALEIQQTVSGDLVGSGRATSVMCPLVIESTSPGALYTCDARLADGTHKVVWVSIDTADGDFSHALSVR